MNQKNIEIWSPANAVKAAEKTCRNLSLPPPELIRFADSAMFRSGEIALRVDRTYRSNFCGARLLNLTRHFQSIGVDTTSPYEGMEALFLENDFCVTFYEYVTIDETLDESVQASLFGRELRRIHELAEPEVIKSIASDGKYINLNYLERKLEGMKYRIDTFVGLPPKGFTVVQMQKLKERFDFFYQSVIGSPILNEKLVVLHGDAHLGNILCSKEKILLLDFEEVGFGHRLLDHLHVWFRDVLLDVPCEIYESFAEGYGMRFDRKEFFLWLEFAAYIYFTWAARLGDESHKHSEEAVKRFSFWEQQWWDEWDHRDKQEAPYLWNAKM